MPSVPIERHRLDNGLRVVLSHDATAPLVAVNLWYSVGSRHERPGRTGFAHLFEHMMFQGSENVGKGEHFALVNAAGGTLNASTWYDRTNYFETLPSHELELALWLEADRMATLLPAMTQEKLDNQREVVKNERRWRVDNQPYGDWDERIGRLLFPESHPYHHPIIGSMEDLEAASLDDVSAFFAAWYPPNNAVMTVAGGFDPATALPAIERYFGPIRANDSLAFPSHGELTLRLGGEVRDVVESQVPLPRVYVAYRIPPFGSDRFEELNVGADLLATGRASRLYRSLVRERRLAQDAVAFVFPLVDGVAVFALWATARPGVAPEELEMALFEEIDRLRSDGPSEDELERVRNLHHASVAATLERIAERADRLSMYTCLFDEPERVNAEVERYEAVDGARAREALESILQPDSRVVLTYLPAEAPPDQIDERHPAVEEAAT